MRIIMSSFIISYFARSEYVNNVSSRMCTFCSDLTSGNGQVVVLYKYKKWVKQVAKILVYWIYWISIFHIFHALKNDFKHGNSIWFTRYIFPWALQELLPRYFQYTIWLPFLLIRIIAQKYSGLQTSQKYEWNYLNS